VVITELPQPLAIRRLVSFSEAVYSGETNVEEVTARRVVDPTDTLRVLQVLAKGYIPVIIDPDGQAIRALHPHVVVDARMLKTQVDLIPTQVKLIIGLGPGFIVGQNCHAVIETKRGHTLGRVIWQGSAEANSGIPEAVFSKDKERVLRAPHAGILQGHVEIGEHVSEGQVVADVEGVVVTAPFPGVLRGLLRSGTPVEQGFKIGDVDPRDDPAYCRLVSDKSLAIGGGVLEAILSRAELRPHLWP
jgi:xanthine dehydrogenase accessory factor